MEEARKGQMYRKGKFSLLLFEHNITAYGKNQETQLKTTINKKVIQ